MGGPLLSGDRQILRRKWVIVAAVFITIALLVTVTSQYHPLLSLDILHTDHARPPPDTQPHSDQPRPTAASGFNVTQLSATELVKPKDIQVVAMIFFGRRSRVELLRCYIERNLVDNGGWLDEVHWVRNTENKDDLTYLDEILASSTHYKMIDLSKEGTGFAGYNNAWGHMERGKLYFKIDDDVVWIADDAIARMVTLKVNHPEYFIVSANNINSPLMGWVHYRLGALHPYFPEYEGIADPQSPDKSGFSPRKSWKYTEYPAWEGPEDWVFDLKQDPPYDGHRWLRLQNDSDIHRTPVSQIEYATWGTGLQSWAIVAQEHYSLLENLLDDRLDRYKFGRVWITDYERLSINFMALWSDEVLDNLPMDAVDEEWLTVNLPKKIGKSIAVESEALTAHFSFGIQDGGLTTTDVLARYKDYAEEKVCHR